jgi:hypothetical protein
MAAQNTLQNTDYQRRGSNVDWAALTSKLGGEVAQIGKDREKAREEIETQYSDTLTKLNKPLNLEKQTLTNFVIDGADKYKKMALDLKKKLYNREISTADYKKTLANAQEYWSNFSDQAKTADERFKLYQDRLTPDANGVVEASDGESFYMNEYLKMADLNNKKMVLGNDGSMYLQETDASGNPVGELIDYRDFARPENLQINRVDVSSVVDGAIGNWKEVDKFKLLGRGGEETITSIKNQPDYKLMKINVADAATSNPKSALSILVDNGVISSANYYSKDSEKDAMLSETLKKTKAEYEAAGKEFTDDDKKAIEMSFIKFEKNAAGEMIPVLTNDQLTAAKDRVGQEIDMQIETKIQASAPQPYSSSGGGGGDNKDSGYATYASVADAWKSGNMNKLNNMNQDGYYFQWDKEANKGKGAIHVKKIEYEKDEDGNSKKVYRYVSTANSARELSRYFWRESTTVQAEQRFDDEKRAAIAAGVGPDSSNTDINTSVY